MPVAAAYIGELSRAEGRGRYFLLYEMIFPVGLMAAGQAGRWLVPALGWQVMFLLGGVPGLIIALLLRRLPESPRWLVARGRLRAAEAIIRSVEASGRDRVAVAPPRPAPSPSGAAAASPWGELLSGRYRRRTLVVWLLWASAFFVTNGINNWAPTLYQNLYGPGAAGRPWRRRAQQCGAGGGAARRRARHRPCRSSPLGHRRLHRGRVAAGRPVAGLGARFRRRRRLRPFIPPRSTRRACARSAPASPPSGCASPRRQPRCWWA